MAIAEVPTADPADVGLGARTLNLQRRLAAWDAIMPFSLGVAGTAGVFTASFGWTVMLPVMAGMLLFVAVGGRLLWAD